MKSITNLVTKRYQLFFRKELSCLKDYNAAKQYLYKSTHAAETVYLFDEDKISNNATIDINKYTDRSYTCGELRSQHVGKSVTLYGWLEYQRMNKFLVLRDAYGQTQCIMKDNAEKIDGIKLESIIKIQGVVNARPSNMINKNLPTGTIEVLIEKLEIVNSAKEKLPFNIREFQKAKEALRMQYRYLDLRFPEMQRNLRLRSQMCMKMREFLVNEHGFVDVETPCLFKATPGGAQEFVVPTKFLNRFYSLTQSPQQFKQMLMAGGIDRYFQIARCFRDETSRPDRQPEFTQLDIEMSFTSIKGIMALIEELLRFIWPSSLQSLPPQKFDQKSYNYIFENYGTDKPDLRYEYKINNCTELFGNNDENFYAGCLVFNPPFINNLTNNDRRTLLKNILPNSKLSVIKVKSYEDFSSKLKGLMSEEISRNLFDLYNLQEGSIFMVAIGDKNNTLKCLGKLREDYVAVLESNGLEIKSDELKFLWITDFPLFELNDAGELKSAHHPFTAPHPEDDDLITSDILKVRSQSYDLVLNGDEIAGGSMRIHDPKLQKEIFKLLKINDADMQHILDMLGSGCPPHGGVAMGLDRFFSVILKTQSIRDVIAFPKTFEGCDPLSGAPSLITEKDKKRYHLQ